MKSILYSIVICLLFVLPSLAAQPGSNTNFPLPMDSPLSETEIASLRLKAEAGDAKAQFRLGEWLLQEHCTWPEEAITAKGREGLEWIAKSAGQGNPDAQFILGYSWRIYGAPKLRSEEYMGWLQKAAKQGHTPAMQYAAQTLLEQEGTPEKAFSYQEAAAKAGNSESQLFLATSYTMRDHTPVDMKKAEEWFNKALKAGEPAAYDAIGCMYLQIIPAISRTVTVPDVAKAAYWLQKAAAAGNYASADTIQMALPENDPGKAYLWQRWFWHKTLRRETYAPQMHEAAAKLTEEVRKAMDAEFEVWVKIGHPPAPTGPEPK